MAAILTMRGDLFPDQNYGLLRLQVITTDWTQSVRNESFEIQFDPRYHVRSKLHAYCSFYHELDQCFGRDPNLSSVAHNIAAYSHDHIRARGWSCGFLMSVVLGRQLLQPTEPEEVDESVIIDGYEVVGGLSKREIVGLKKDDQMCSVCLEDFREGAVVTMLLPCSHKFHHKCIAKWLRKKENYPLCRSRCTV